MHPGGGQILCPGRHRISSADPMTTSLCRHGIPFYATLYLSMLLYTLVSEFDISMELGSFEFLNGCVDGCGLLGFDLIHLFPESRDLRQENSYCPW